MPSGHEDIEPRVRRIYPLLAGPGYMDSHPEDMDQIVEYEKAKRMTLKSYERQLQAVMNWQGSADGSVMSTRRFLSCTETQTHSSRTATVSS